MKKIILILLVGLCSFGLHGQAVGIQFGMNFANGVFDDGAQLDDVKSISGIRIGPVVQFPLGSVVEIHTGAIYSQQGFELPTSKTTIDYIDVPVNLALSFDLATFGAFVKAGPVFGIGVGGKFSDASGEEDLKFGSGDDELKLLDVGGEIGAGVKLGTLQIAASYEVGLSDLSNTDLSYKNKVFHISLAFVLGGN